MSNGKVILELISNREFILKENILKELIEGDALIQKNNDAVGSLKSMSISYHVRSQYLNKYSSEHGKLLKQCTDEFLNSIKSVQDEKIRIITVRTKNEYHYLLLCDLDYSEIYGCLKVNV